ncbi:MAG: hypothetical protein ACI9WS_002647 [Paraglaciecola psychrophila]|jgi:hypothetical protein
MSDLHIDDFYKDVALIFLRLYASFPRKTILYVEDITGDDQPDEFGLHSDRFQSCFSTMIWLGEQQYLSYQQTIKQEALDQVVLTQRGFILLSSQSDRVDDALDNSADDTVAPSLQQHSRSHIIQLRQALKSRSSTTIKNCIHYQLSQ